MKNPEANRLKNSDLIKYNTLAALVLTIFLVGTYFMATNELKWAYDSLSTIIKNNYKNLWVYRIVFFSYGCLLYYGSLTKVVLHGARLDVLSELFIVFYGITYVMLGFFSFDLISENLTFMGKSFETFYLLLNTAHILLLLSILSNIILDTGLRTAHFFFFLIAATFLVWATYDNKYTGVIEKSLFMVQLILLAGFYNRSKKVKTKISES